MVCFCDGRASSDSFAMACSPYVLSVEGYSVPSGSKAGGGWDLPLELELLYFSPWWH